MSTTASKDFAQADEKAEINELIKQINLTILNLQRKRLHLSRELSVAIKQKSPKIEEIGDENTSLEGTKSQNNDEKANGLRSLIEQFDQKIKEAQLTKNNLSKLGQLQLVNNIDQKEKLNEDGLPFMDIQEEVDEDGNVISSKINNVPVEAEKKTENSPKVEASSSSKHVNDKGKDKDDELMQLFSDMELMPGQNRSKQPLDQDELLDKIDELKISPEEKFNLKKICVQAFEDYNENDEETDEKDPIQIELDSTKTENSNSGKRNIDTDNLLELELLADEFDNEEDKGDKYADDEDWDYDFEEDDDDDDDDVSADDLLYGGNPNTTWLGGKLGDSKSSDLFWNQIAELRQKEIKSKDTHKHGLDVSELDEAATESTDGKKKQKSVRFAENLDIKNVENISDSLKNPQPFKKTSLFKQNRTHCYSNGNGNTPIKDESHVKDKIVEDTIVERDVDESPMRENIVEDTIVEKDVGNQLNNAVSNNPPNASNTPEMKNKPASRFKALRKNVPSNNNGTENLTNAVGGRGDMNDSMISDKGLEESFDSGITHSAINTDKFEILGEENIDKQVESGETMIPTNTQLDYSNMQDIDTMAKAYLMGIYDDDIDIDGPLVEDLKDFEELNKIIESKHKGKTMPEVPIGGEVYDKNSSEVGMDYEENDDIDDYDENDENEAMINDIEEREFDEDDSNRDIDENDITNQELSDSYYRMREKMQSKQSPKHQELGFEPMDEEGNSIRVSRFKARMNK